MPTTSVPAAPFPSFKDPSLEDLSLDDPSLDDSSPEDPSLKVPSLKVPSLKDLSLEDFLNVLSVAQYSAPEDELAKIHFDVIEPKYDKHLRILDAIALLLVQQRKGDAAAVTYKLLLIHQQDALQCSSISQRIMHVHQPSWPTSTRSFVF